jgi:peptidoglycan/xylan/chitin deacetylase (PgdA/CDA1 family)
MDEADQRADFERGLTALARLGIKPRGHRSAAWGATWETAALVAEYGLIYESNLMDDDRPYILETAKGAIAELPPAWVADDFAQYAFMVDPVIGHNIESPLKAIEVWRLELDAMRDYGCLLQLTCHPFLSGRPSRLKALRGFIEYALDLGDVAILTCEQIAERVLADPEATRRRHVPFDPDPTVYPNY